MSLKKVKLGTEGLVVNQIGLGCMGFTAFYGGFIIICYYHIINHYTSYKITFIINYYHYYYHKLLI